MTKEELIKKLRVIDHPAIDPKDAHANSYADFFAARDAYISTQDSELTAIEETKLLLKMIDVVGFKSGSIDFFVNKTGQSKLNLLDFLLARKNSLMVAVPKIMHFICYDALTDIQRDYIRLWLDCNPTYEVYIWIDSNTHLSRELFIRLQQKAVQKALADNEIALEINKAFEKELIRLQNEFYRFIKTLADSVSSFFDHAVKLYFISHPTSYIDIQEKKGVAEVLEELRLDNEKQTNDCVENLKQGLGGNRVTLKEISKSDHLDLYDQAGYYKIYQQELALRGNVLAACEIVRLLILQQYGGIILDTDLLPEVKPALVARLTEIKQTEFPDTLVQIERDPSGLADRTDMLYIRLFHDTEPF